ncbi:MAG: 3-hydroxyacyl-CoA dehydrogenase NAD-binding domain-containing protein, partial [Firmicutes bacterium]|nr:3-hydroxyacyl-CoA dehydrogenase NAD-binding domain-containing protein [Bacillota bacterium]
DWVLEAVIENLSIKRDLWQRVEGFWKKGTVVSSNTSGISIAAMVADNSPEFKRHFLGTHFFNPPRYMRLLEIIPTPDTDPEVVSLLREFGERTLGKGVVLAKDTPNFIANRVGVYGLMVTLQAMTEFGLLPDEMDVITGPAMGRPKSATFRTLDIVGLDTMVHVANNVREQVKEEWEKKTFEIPGYLQEMLQRGWLGDKTKQGFYKEVRTERGREFHALNPATMEYQPPKKSTFASLEAAKATANLGERLRALVYSQDKAGQLAWYVLKKTLLYSAARLPEIADDIFSVDRAMRWGFNWEMGPFETWDAIGVRKSVQRMEAEGEVVPALVKKMLTAGHENFYEERGRFYITLGGRRELVPQNSRGISLARRKEEGKTIRANAGASLVDMGDDVLCLEFHSPKSAIGADIINMVKIATEEVAKNHRGLVVSSEASNFAVGANLMLILMEAQDENWDELDQMVREFQQATLRLKYLDRPVVAAPFGLTLGGGVEMCFGADRIQACAETYLGLVEVGVGLIPAGGGTKELWSRTVALVPTATQFSGPFDLQPYLNRVFETIAMAKVSTSGPEARSLGYLRPGDGISVNRDHLLWDAKEVVLYLDRLGYQPPHPPEIPVLGEMGRAVLELGLYTLKTGGYATEHDVHIGRKLAYILTGGQAAPGSLVSEQYLLDLEREAFLSLCGHPKTQARIQHMLTKGKPLRN